MFEPFEPFGDLALRMAHENVNPEWFVDRATCMLAEVEQQIFNETSLVE